jgi:hypothetical protein
MSKITLQFSSPIAKEYRWFAWYPVKTVDRGIRWLVPVYRRKYQLHSWLDSPYREPFFMHSAEKGVLG